MYKYYLYRLLHNKDVIRLIANQFNELDNHLLSKVLENIHLLYQVDELCVKYGNINLLKELELTNKNKLLRKASKKGHINIVKYLVSMDAGVTAQDNYAVRYASANGHIETVKYLVSIGADVTALDNYAIDCAFKNDNIEMVKYLFTQGANL